ncbi:MAG: metallophosphoesterase [Pseudomonadota bacterium]
MISSELIMFFLFFLAVWGGGHAYLAHRLLRPLHGRRWLQRGGLVLLGLSLCVVPLVFFSRRFGLDPAWTDRLAWVAFLDMGIFLVLLPLLVARDLGWFTLTCLHALRRRWRGQRSRAVPDDPARRHFLANTMNAGLLGLTGSMAIAGYREATQLARVREIELPLAGLPAVLHGFHIVQLSDIHLGPTIKGDYLAAIVERSNALAPDLVAITGDLVDGLTSDLMADVAPLTRLRARHGSWFVTGNHEYYWGPREWLALLPTLGVNVLVNAHRVIEHDGARLLLAGVTDYSAGRYLPDHDSDPRRARTGAADADVSLLLAHQPRSAYAGAAAGFDVQLSGHIHGGQFFPWNLLIGLVQPFGLGLHRVDGRMWLYVSAGTGYWGPPSRLGVPAEITSLRLARA